MTLRPVAPLDPLRDDLQRLPTERHRIVELCRGARLGIAAGAAVPLLPKDEVLIHCSVDLQPMLNRFLDQPAERVFRGTALRLAIAAADVGVNSRKPDLFDVLRLCAGLIEGVWPVILRFCPPVDPKHPAPFINRNGLSKDLDI